MIKMFDINAVKIEPKLAINFSKRKKRVGIWNKGQNNKFINNKIGGFDIGIKDEGKDTLAKDNEID